MKSRYIHNCITILLCTFLFFMIIPTTITADTGPKPSVRITFENLGEEPCYGTLLSESESTGPSSAWDGIEAHAQYNENPNGQYTYKTFGYDVWKAFVDYSNEDDYYFLQEAWQINETKELAWTYYPPRHFKILLYFPETGAFAISDVCERYAFDSYFTVNMDGVTLSVTNNTEASMNVKKTYQYRTELVSLVARTIITILIEMIIAVLFGFRKKNQLLLLVGVNCVTQIILNVLLNLIHYNMGPFAFVLFYILLELLVFVIEAFVYCTILKKISTKQKKNWYYILYAFLANTISFTAGIAIAKIIPDIF